MFTLNKNTDLVPFQDMLAEYLALKPADVDGVMNTSSFYWRHWCLKKIFGRFEFTGLPDEWDFDYFLTTLFLEGHLAITDTSMGVLPLRCGLSGLNVFSHPTTAVIANPILGSFEREIDTDCALVKLQYDYAGCGWMLQRYATMLAMCDSGIAVNLMNSKVASVFMAESKNQAETMKKMYDEISRGKPAVFVREGTLTKDNVYSMHVKENYIADQIQQTKGEIIDEFLTEIGYKNANSDKRERLISSEVNANNEEVRGSVEHWLETMREGLKRANELYSLNLAVRLRSFREEGEQDEPAESAELPAESA